MFVCSECGGPQLADGHCPTDGTPLVAIGEDVLLGTTIGVYRIARLLGVGGMGRVYKGVHPQIGSRVAIKVLSRECTDRKDLVVRFFKEAKAVNLIAHESIVNVLDLATLPDGRPYIIMEYLDGAPLAAIVEHAVQTGVPMPVGGLARLAVEVLDALHAAHAKGIVHRDLKPDNIFVAPSGRPKVLDFGIAKLTEPDGNSSTRTGSLLGTPHYMSPEQAAGRPVDHRADIYAIGVILFECVTGRKLFVAESLFDLLRKQVEEQPPSPRLYRPDLDPGFENVIMCALAKAPEQRFATAQAMSMALQHATAHLPPEQWTPITGSGTQRALPSGWQHNPPATWGGSRAAARPSAQPLDRYLGNQSTVSASSGQVQKQPAAPTTKKSRKGLWIGLAAIVLVGTGVTVAVVATGGGNPPAVAAETPAPPVAPLEPKIEAKQTKPPAKDPGDSDTDGDEWSDAEKQIKAAPLPDDVKKEATDAIARARKDMPGAPGKQPPPANSDDAEDPAQDPTPAQPGKRPAGAWVEERAIQIPGWNPARVDVDAFVRVAIAEARKQIPDAQLTRIDVSGVTANGFANLTLPTQVGTGDIDIRFISPSHGKLDPRVAPGVPQNRLCEFRVMGSPSGVEIRSMFKTNCKTKSFAAPPCRIAALWKAAIAAGAPANGVANVDYYQAPMWGTPRWNFTIGYHPDVVFTKMWNGCP